MIFYQPVISVVQSYRCILNVSSQPDILFSSMNEMQGCTLSVIPTALVCVLFGPAVPSLLFYAIFVLLFILGTVTFFVRQWEKIKIAVRGVVSRV